MDEETGAQKGKASCPTAHVELAAEPYLESRSPDSNSRLPVILGWGRGGRWGPVPYPATRVVQPCSPQASGENLGKLQGRNEPLDFGQELSDRAECWGMGVGAVEVGIQLNRFLWVSSPTPSPQSIHSTIFIICLLCARDCSRFSCDQIDICDL